jgi:hypothetical protein
VITTGKRWMASIKSWVSGEKHPDTPRTEYVNCYEYDRVRRILKGRCAICKFVVSRDEEAVREISLKCEDSTCCTVYITTKPHQVCHLCYDMWHAVYMNPKMRNMNYFKEIEEKEKKAIEDFKKRDDNKRGW